MTCFFLPDLVPLLTGASAQVLCFYMLGICGLGHSVLAYESTLKGIRKLQVAVLSLQFVLPGYLLGNLACISLLRAVF
jgi:hypothetical protein